MKIVIDIDDNIYTRLFDNGVPIDLTTTINDAEAIATAIRNGTPLPERHGRLIDADYLREDFKASKKISFAERMDISCIVDHSPTIIEGSDSE